MVKILKYLLKLVIKIGGDGHGAEMTLV